MSKVKIGVFQPSACQILSAALAVAKHPGSSVEVLSMPEGPMVLGGAPWEGRRKSDYERGLSYLHDLSGRNDRKSKVFLGGACNPTTWRQDIAIPFLTEHGCEFYNPQIDDWSEQDAACKAAGFAGGIMEVEAIHKKESSVLLFVFDSATRAIATLNEAVEFMMAGGRHVVLVEGWLEPGTVIAGQAVSESEARDINEARHRLFKVARDRGTPVYGTIEAAMINIVYHLHDEGEDIDIVSPGLMVG